MFVKICPSIVFVPPFPSKLSVVNVPRSSVSSDNEEGVEDGEEADESDTEQPARDAKTKTVQQQASHDEPDGMLSSEHTWSHRLAARSCISTKQQLVASASGKYIETDIHVYCIYLVFNACFQSPDY